MPQRNRESLASVQRFGRYIREAWYGDGLPLLSLPDALEVIADQVSDVRRVLDDVA